MNFTGITVLQYPVMYYITISHVAIPTNNIARIQPRPTYFLCIPATNFSSLLYQDASKYPHFLAANTTILPSLLIMPYPQDFEIRRHFVFSKAAGRTYERARCKTCSWEQSANITRCKEHLEKCPGRKAIKNAQNALNPNTQTVINRFTISLST